MQLEESRRRPKKKCMKVIRKDMKARRVDEDMVRDREGYKEKIRVAVPTYIR